MSIKCAFLFPGQGSQAQGMGSDFFQNSDIAREMVLEASKRTGIDFSNLLFEENDLLGQTEYTQPAILLVGAIAHKLFVDATDITPVLTMGHSLGEFSALVASGALDAIDAVELVNLRGKLMAEACSKQEVGMMVSLGLSDEVVEEVCEAQRASATVSGPLPQPLPPRPLQCPISETARCRKSEEDPLQDLQKQKIS